MEPLECFEIIEVVEIDEVVHQDRVVELLLVEVEALEARKRRLEARIVGVDFCEDLNASL